MAWPLGIKKKQEEPKEEQEVKIYQKPKVEQAEVEQEAPVKQEQQKIKGNFYQIVETTMLESGLLRTVTISNIVMGEVGKLTKVEED